MFVVRLGLFLLPNGPLNLFLAGSSNLDQESLVTFCYFIGRTNPDDRCTLDHVTFSGHPVNKSDLL